MSEPIEQAIDAAPAPEAEPIEAPFEAAPAAEEEGREDVDFDSLPLDSDEARALVYEGDKPKAESAEVASPAEAAPEEEAPEEGEQPPQEKPILPEVSDDKMAGRITVKQFDDKDQKALKIMYALNEGKKPGEAGYTSLIQVVKLMEEQQAAKPHEATPVAAAQPSAVEEANTKLGELKTKAAELVAKRKELESYGTETTEVESEMEALQDQIADARMDAKLAARDHEAELARSKANQQQSAVQQREQDKETVIKRFPSAADGASPLGQRLAEKIAAAKDPSHPDHDLLFVARAATHFTTEAATEVASEIAERDGIPFEKAYASLLAQPKQVAAQPATKSAQPAVAPRKIAPAPGGQRTAPPQPAKSAEQTLAEIGDDADAAWEYVHGKGSINALR